MNPASGSLPKVDMGQSHQSHEGHEDSKSPHDIVSGRGRVKWAVSPCVDDSGAWGRKAESRPADFPSI